jgi:sulfate adenylyltransferase subunit 1
MTSACGVISDSEVDDSKDIKCAFAYGNLKANGDIFEEFYYNLDSMTIQKMKPSGKTYTVGDEIPVCGDSYNYPDYFDVLVFRDKVAVKVRNKIIEDIISIDNYEYTGLPVMNGRGFAVLVDTKDEYDSFYDELKKAGTEPDSDFFNKWVSFEAYRNMVFINEKWD